MDKNTKCPHHPAADGLPVRNALQHLPPMFCLYSTKPNTTRITS